MHPCILLIVWLFLKFEEYVYLYSTGGKIQFMYVKSEF